MSRRALMVWALLGIAPTGLCTAGAEEPDGVPSAPKIASTDQAFITWVVRRTLEQYLTDGSTYELPYRPAALAELRCPVAVTLRVGGRALALGVSLPGAVLDGARQAALEAVKVAVQSGPMNPEALSRLRIEVEAIGDVRPAPTVPHWGSAQSYAFLEPGVHGLVLQLGEAKGAMRPSEFIISNTSVEEAVCSLTERINPGREGHQGLAAAWFRTTHWWEWEPGGKVVQLQRGLIVLPPEAVTDETLNEAVTTLANYILYRQKPEGEFSYQYAPSTDTYSEANNYVHQAGAVWDLALYARLSGDATATQTADKALQFLTRYVIDLEGIEGAGYFLGPDRSTDLGATALLCLALSDHPQSASFRPLRDKLVAGMLWLQKSSGEFIPVFPPTWVPHGEDLFPGQALLGLARVYPDGPQGPIAQAFAKAFPAYREEFRRAPQVGFVPWHTQAFARMARQTEHREYAEFVFEMNDWLIAHQLDAENCVWPELHGGLDPRGAETVSAGTASALHGLVEALALARELGDAERTRRYERAARAATRFVLQLQFRPEEGFYVRSPIDGFGGIRRSPWNNLIRIDHCARALTALVRAREVLFSRSGAEAAERIDPRE